MDILIISHFGSTYSENDNDRFLYLAKMLDADNQVEIITSSFCHEKKNHRKKTECKWPFTVTFLDEIGYKKNVCLKRFLSHFIWGINVKKYLKQRKKPDVIYCAVPSLTGPYFVAKYCKNNNVKFIIDIQDLWPEAFKLVFDIPLLNYIIFVPFTYLVNKIYKQADEIVAVSNTYIKRALKVNKKIRAGKAVYLGTDLTIFDKNINVLPIKKQIEGELWLAYCGTLGSSYDLITVFNALLIIRYQGLIPPKFIIMGDGPLKEKFEQYANEKKLDVIFTGRLPYDKMCSVLCKSDITVNPIMRGAAQSIINKHADYLASGKPIVSTQDNIEFRTLIDEYNMGFNCGNVKELAEAIILLMNDDKKRKIMGENARRCAEEKFDRKIIYREIVSIIIGENRCS